MFQSIRRTKEEQLRGLSGYVSARKVAHNIIERTLPDGSRVIRFHLTDIVTFSPSGSVTLNSGGHKSFTTKERINRYLPKGWNLWAEKGIWYLSNRNACVRYVYSDGVTIASDGTVTGCNPDEEKRARDLSKKISNYCRYLANMPVLPRPDYGDCWFCSMHTSDGKSLGEKANDTDHLESHLEEKYIMGSLILNAMRAAGCTEYMIGMAFSDQPYVNTTGRRYAIRAVRRYFKASLGLSR